MDTTYINQILTEEIEKILIWLKANKLSLNVDKTNFIVFSRRRTINDVYIKIEGKNIERVTKVKFLGVIIDSKLTWKEHINYISNSISKSIGIIYKAKKVLTRSTLIGLYYSFVYPYLTYCNIVWGRTHKIYVNRLFLLQKKIIRIVTFSNFQAHTHGLFKETEILNIFQITIYLVGIFVFQFKQNKLPTIFDSFFTHVHNIHTHVTRNNDLLYPPLSKTTHGQSNIRYSGVLIWNKIVPIVKYPSNLYSFKWSLKKVLVCESISV